MCLASSISGYCGSSHIPSGCLSCFLVLTAGNRSLRDQASLGRDGLHLPRHLPPPGSQSLFCLWGLYTDVGESQFLDASRKPQFSLECQTVGNSASVLLVRRMTRARSSGEAARSMLGLQPALPAFKCEQVPGFHRVPDGR